MPVKVTSRRVYKATLAGPENGPNLIRLVRDVETTVKDSTGRHLYEHPKAREARQTPYEELDVLTVREAAELLRSLTDALAFLAEDCAATHGTTAP